MGPGSAVGDADGLGGGLSLGLALGLEVEVGVGHFPAGLEAGVRGPFAVQPAMNARARRSTTPFLTAPETNIGMDALRASSRRKSPRIPLDRLALS